MARSRTAKARAGMSMLEELGGSMALASPPPATEPAGSDGVAAPGGFLYSAERDPRLVNREKWVTYDDATLNTAIVASAMRMWTDLAGSAKWRAEPNKRGGKNAQRAAELVTEGLLEAQMSKPWRNVVKRQLMKKFRGFAMHEVILRRRPDGMMVVGDLQHRPQWTIYRWIKPNEQTAWIGVEQLTRLGARFQIPRERLLYSVEDTLTDNPDGVGLLRHIVELARIRQVYLNLEGMAAQTDLGGMPIGRAPLKALRDAAKADGKKSKEEISAFIAGATQFLDNILKAHNKRPDQGLMLDSSPYFSKDAGQTPSSVMQWAFDVVRSATNIGPVSTAIGRIDREIARVMCAEWLLLGSGDSGGAYSMLEDKTAMFGLSINSGLQDVGDDATRDVAALIVAVNGLDPETDTPRLVPEPIATASVVDACRALALIAQAGLHPKDEAINVIRGRAELPPAPDIDDADWMLPRGTVIVPDSDPTLATPDNDPSKPKGGASPTAAAPGKPGNVNAQTKRRRAV